MVDDLVRPSGLAQWLKRLLEKDSIGYVKDHRIRKS